MESRDLHLEKNNKKLAHVTRITKMIGKILFSPHHCTQLIDAGYCYRHCSVVCLCVCLCVSRP